MNFRTRSSGEVAMDKRESSGTVGRVTIVFVLMLTLVGRAGAWSESGHHLMALLAFDELTDAEQQQLLSILKAHPRYAEDFTPPEKIRSVDRFRVGTAGYWPDIARKQPKYDRPTWHYQLGATLTLGDLATLSVPETPGSLPAAATLETQELYIAQAVELCRRVLGDRTASDSDRAIALCWLGHLVGDAHQPCHAGSLYAERLFPEGDRGANSIPTRQKNNMHALWDGLLGGRFNEGTMNRRVAGIQAKSDYETVGEAAVSRPSGLDPLTWLAESREASVQYAYTREVLGPVEALMKEGGELPVLYLSEAYLRQAGGLAELRAAEAGHRLAKIWKEGLSAEQDGALRDGGAAGR